MGIAYLKMASTIFSPSPTYFWVTAPIRTLINVAPDSLAIACTATKIRKTHQLSSKHTMVRKNQQIPTKLTQKPPRISYSLPTFPYENLGHLLTGTVASRLGEKAPGVLTGRHSFRTNILFWLDESTEAIFISLVIIEQMFIKNRTVPPWNHYSLWFFLYYTPKKRQCLKIWLIDFSHKPI